MTDIIDTVNEDFQNGQTILLGKRLPMLLARAFELRNEAKKNIACSAERDEYYAAWQEASKEIDRLNFRVALLEEQTKKAIRLSKMERGNELAQSYLADWDALHQTMDEDYAEISGLRDLVKRQQQTIEELESLDDRSGPFGRERFE